MKAQIVVSADNLKVLCISVCKGKTHDFQLFKDSRLAVLKNIKILADSGYQGIAKYHSNSIIYRIVHTPDECFRYINEMPESYSQLSLFDMLN